MQSGLSCYISIFFNIHFLCLSGKETVPELQKFHIKNSNPDSFQQWQNTGSWCQFVNSVYRRFHIAVYNLNFFG